MSHLGAGGSPWDGAVPVAEGASRSIRPDVCYCHDGVGALLNSLGATAVVEVSRGVAGIDGVDADVRVDLGVLVGEHVQRRLG